MAQTDGDTADGIYWRRPAPIARRLARCFYAWRNPGLVFLASCLAAFPFIAAALFAPALLSFAPTADMLAPIAEARAVISGAADTRLVQDPFFLMLLLAADLCVDTPGRIHLLAKAIGAAIIVAPLAYMASIRLPALQSIFLTGALGAYAAAPFAGSGELAFALLTVLCLGFLSAPAKNGIARNIIESVFSGAALFCLWMSAPVFALAGFLALSVCPFVGGKAGGVRYAITLIAFAALTGLVEVLLPGMVAARAAAMTALVETAASVSVEPLLSMTTIAVGAGLVIFLSMVFGGAGHVKAWAPALGIALVASAASLIAGVSVWPALVVAGAIAAFSTASPFYDGIFRQHDRATVAIACVAALITMASGLAIGGQTAMQLSLQHKVAQSAPEEIRRKLALVQPGGTDIAQWIEDGRFSTPEARALFSLAPTEQSQLLLAAAEKARRLSDAGAQVAILTAADSACILLDNQPCHADGPSAAARATIVLAPRLDLDPSTVKAKNKAEALLYTEFRLVQQSAFWDVWARRDASTPPMALAVISAAGQD